MRLDGTILVYSRKRLKWQGMAAITAYVNMVGK